MFETTENENIDRVDTFESVDYSDKITVADGAKLVINTAVGNTRRSFLHSAIIAVAATFNLQT